MISASHPDKAMMEVRPFLQACLCFTGHTCRCCACFNRGVLEALLRSAKLALSDAGRRPCLPLTNMHAAAETARRDSQERQKAWDVYEDEYKRWHAGPQPGQPLSHAHHNSEPEEDHRTPDPLPNFVLVSTLQCLAHSTCASASASASAGPQPALPPTLAERQPICLVLRSAMTRLHLDESLAVLQGSLLQLHLSWGQLPIRCSAGHNCSA